MRLRSQLIFTNVLVHDTGLRLQWKLSHVFPLASHLILVNFVYFWGKNVWFKKTDLKTNSYILRCCTWNRMNQIAENSEQRKNFHNSISSFSSLKLTGELEFSFLVTSSLCFTRFYQKIQHRINNWSKTGLLINHLMLNLLVCCKIKISLKYWVYEIITLSFYEFISHKSNSFSVFLIRLKLNYKPWFKNQTNYNIQWRQW